MFWTYYVICFVYCIIMSIRKWNRDVMAGGLGISPGLESLGLLLMCWILAPIDVFLTWTRIYKEAEEANKERTNKEINEETKTQKKKGRHTGIQK